MKHWRWFIENADGTFSPDPEKVDVYDCPRCKDKQVRPKGSIDLGAPPVCEDCQERQRMEFRVAREAERAEERIRESGVPVLYRSGFVPPRSWPSLPSGKSLETWRGDPWCLTFFGVTGAGKSYLASEVFARLVSGSRVFGSGTARDEAYQPHRGTWIAAPLAAERLFGPRSYETFDRLASCEVLLIDELGRELSVPAREKLMAILGVRYADQLPTILTTNLEPVGTATRPGLARIDPALARRLDSGAWIEMREKWSPR